MPFSLEQACYINIEKSLQGSAGKEYARVTQSDLVNGET